ncbi:MAG: hypothetical protein WCK55_19785 [Verrucomicrobiota bacterium]
MSLQQIKSEAASLPEEQRRELIGYLLSLKRQTDSAYWDRIESQIANNEPSHWVGEADLDTALRLNEPAP